MTNQEPVCTAPAWPYPVMALATVLLALIVWRLIRPLQGMKQHE